MNWKRWLKRTIGAVVLVLVLRTAWLVGEREWLRAEGEKEYAAAVVETEQTDPDWRWDALNAKRPRPPAGKNGADLIPKVTAQMPKEWGHRLDSTESGSPRDKPPVNTRFDPELITAAREELARARPAVELARTLKEFPSGYREIRLAPNPFGALIEDTQATRSLSYLLHWDVVIAIEDGNTALAAAGLLAMLNASRSIGDEPFLISQLVRIATRTVAARSAEWVLGQTKLTDQQLTKLQASWAADAEEPLLLYSLRGERATLDQFLQKVATGVIPIEEVSSREEGLRGDFERWRLRKEIPKNRAFLLRHLTRWTALAQKPWHEQQAALSSDPITEADQKDVWLACLMMAPIEHASPSFARSTAEARTVVVGLACERFRLKNGRWPKELAELPGEMLPGGVPLDPFDGKPLRFRRLDDGIVIYSIGPDGTDNEGTVARDRPNAPGTDIGFRLWNPEQRRKPAVQPGGGDAIPPPREVKP